MVGLLALLMSIAAVLIWFYLPVAVCPRDPGSIAGLATILSQSPGTIATLKGLDLHQVKGMKTLLSGQRYHTRMGRGQFLVDTAKERQVITGDSPSVSWWHPLVVKIRFRVVIFGIPLALIAALETLYQFSHKHSGIALVDSELAYIRYTWAYIPALTMLLVRTG